MDEIYSLIYPDKNLADLDENVSSYLVRWLRDMDQSQGVYTVDKHTGKVTSVLTFILRNDKPICITSIHSTDNSVEHILTLFIKKIACTLRLSMKYYPRGYKSLKSLRYKNTN